VSLGERRLRRTQAENPGLPGRLREALSARTTKKCKQNDQQYKETVLGYLSDSEALPKAARTEGPIFELALINRNAT
jgi:hypothetical protein